MDLGEVRTEVRGKAEELRAERRGGAVLLAVKVLTVVLELLALTLQVAVPECWVVVLHAYWLRGEGLVETVLGARRN